MVLRLVGDNTYDAICGMGFPWCILVGGSCMGIIWNDGVEVSRLCINEVKLLVLQDGLFLYLGTFGGDAFGYGRQNCF